MNTFIRAFHPNGLRAIADRRRPTWTPETFRAQALELMALSHVAWARCRRIAAGRDAVGQVAWFEIAVPTAAQAGAVYLVRYKVASDCAVCDCVMAQRG